MPIIRSSEHGKRVVQLATWAEAAEYGTSIAEQAKNFGLLWKNVSALVASTIAPAQPRRKVPSLYIQGHHGSIQGFLGRPEIPCQSEIATVLNLQLKRQCKSLS